MPLNLIGADGQTVTIDPESEYQYTPEGFNSGLASNSVPLSIWDGAGGSYRNLYETQSSVARAVNKLTRQIARMPLKVYRGDSAAGKERVTDGPLVEAIKSPAPGRGAIDLKQWLTLPALVHGNATVEKVRGRGGRIIGFWPLNWRLMTPKWIDEDPELPIDYWIYTPAKGKRRVLQTEDVLHVAWHPPAGQLGVSPLKQLGVTMTIERSAQLWQASTFRNAARPSGGVTLPDNDLAKDKEFRREFRDDLARLQQGGHNAGRPIVLPPGGKWEAFSYNAAEAALIDQRKLGLGEVLGVYDVPPPMVGDLEKATFSNISEQHQMLFTDVLGPWFSLEQEVINSQLCAVEPEFGDFWVEYDLRDVLRGDPVKAAVAEERQIRNGTLTIDEARDANNRPRFGGNASKPLIQTNNLSLLESLGDEEPDNDDSEQARALAGNLARVGDRLYRNARAGTDGWDPERFSTELTADLCASEAVDDGEAITAAATDAVAGIVADAGGDPDQLRDGIAALDLPTLMEVHE